MSISFGLGRSEWFVVETRIAEGDDEDLMRAFRTALTSDRILTIQLELHGLSIAELSYKKALIKHRSGGDVFIHFEAFQNYAAALTYFASRRKLFFFATPISLCCDEYSRGVIGTPSNALGTAGRLANL